MKESTLNRYRALIRSILKAAVDEWDMLDRAPKIRTPGEQPRVRWETHEAMQRLLAELPRHLRLPAAFTLQTGLRAGNVRELRWGQVNWARREILIPRIKSDNPLMAPLNDRALKVRREAWGAHDVYVFTYGRHGLGQLSTRAWYNALERAGIADFRWHDLRHTWATWHILHGTSLYELQRLGGWKTLEMVTRYAHACDDYLHRAANRLVQNEHSGRFEGSGNSLTY